LKVNFLRKRKIFLSLFFLVFLALFFFVPMSVSAAGNFSIPNIDITISGTEDPSELAPALQVLFLISIIALAPSLLMMLTGFTRIIVVLHFMRAAMGTQQMPPNQVLVGLALILTLFLMGPIFTEINDNALRPLSEGQITMEEAFERGMAPLSNFMRDQVERNDINLFVELSKQTFDSEEELPDRIIIPAFVLGELTKGFYMGFVLYLPYIVVDMVVASVLMAMGMMMLPPAMISLPFKLMMFLLTGGFNHIIRYVMLTF